jgi:hypothetical protein
MAGDVRNATEQKRRDEDQVRERIADGESLYDLIGIEEVLEASE